MAATLPLLRGFFADDTLGWQGRQSIRAARFCGAASELAGRLPQSAFAFNLCEGQLEFMLASAAALVAGQTLILPPARVPGVMESLRRHYPDSYCLVDYRREPDVAFDAERVRIGVESEGASDWPPPAFAATHIAAVLFTSGSTGEPQPQRKTWKALVEGADTFVKSLGAPVRGSAILGTVAPQHMFGFETTVMLPLQSGTPIVASRPNFPADLTDALDAAAPLGIGERWLMTTPLQLRTFHRALPVIRGLHRIIASTMPLDRELAQAVERDWGVTVHEIYGCTEGGILATRRPATESHFTGAAGLTFSYNQDSDVVAVGGHLPSPLHLADRIRLHDDGFELRGRDSDIVKIAGKRASLQALTRQVLAIPGVHDAVVFLPESNAPRVAAFVVAPALSIADLRAQLARSIDSAFMPRPFVNTESLPRSGAGKLSHAALRQMLAAHCENHAEADAAPR